MIQIAKPDRAPRILRDANSRGPKESKKLKLAYDAGERDFEFKSSIYAAKSVKNLLLKVQSNKCCFCESKFTHIAFGDVEHFRPKGGTKQKKSDALAKPGYYWLAYEWSNLFLSCTLCNQRYKKNLFPLADPSKRAKSHHNDIGAETPLFVNPSTDNPQDYIAFREEMAYPIPGNDRGKTTINGMGLNRPALAELRRDRLVNVKLTKRTVDVLTVIRQRDGHLTPDLEALLQEHRRSLDEYSERGAEYSSMIGIALG